MMIPIDKMSTTDKVIESIRSYIQEPGRNPGEKLPTENELGKQLGVGRSSIREALRVLQTMGYVTIVHGKGAFIKACQPSSEEAERWFEGNIFALRDIYMVREALEPLVAREAARHITEEALAELRQIVDQTAHAAALPPEDGAQDPADLPSQPKKRGKRIAIIAGIVVAVLALAYGALALLDSGRILENVVVAGVDVGGMRKAEAITAVDAVAAAYEQNTMTLHFSDGDERITPQQSKLQLDVKGAVGAAYRYGRVLGVSIPGVTKAPAEWYMRVQNS